MKIPTITCSWRPKADDFDQDGGCISTLRPFFCLKLFPHTHNTQWLIYARLVFFLEKPIRLIRPQSFNSKRVNGIALFTFAIRSLQQEGNRDLNFHRLLG